jgi:hypothetical protein
MDTHKYKPEPTTRAQCGLMGVTTAKAAKINDLTSPKNEETQGHKSCTHTMNGVCKRRLTYALHAEIRQRKTP